MAEIQQTTGTRERLLAAAGRILEEQGAKELRARHLSAEVGTSTMAIYTHFGGMPGLIDELVRDGLRRFAAHVRGRPLTGEPMVDLISGGRAYGEFALANPQLYRLMFGVTDASARTGPQVPDASAVWQMEEGVDAFSVLLESVEKVIAAGEIRPQDARAAALQVLSVTHGFLLLLIGGFIEEELQDLIAPLTVNLMVGLGAERDNAERALHRAMEIPLSG